MGISIHSSKLRSGGYKRRQTRPMSEINMTPMVDVMLVLLIVFMVAAPLLTVGVPVDLPRVKAKALTAKIEPIVVTVSKSGQIFIKEHETNMDGLVPQIKTLFESRPEAPVYVRGDKDASYGAIMAVMGKLNLGGITKVALVSQMPQPSEDRKDKR